MIKTFQEYQKATNKTAVYPRDTALQAITYCMLGLGGEAGELQNKLKKVYRDDNGVITLEKHKQLFDEVSDCFWYLSQLCTELGVSMEDVATHNINKLNKRLVNNTIKGSGDNR